MEANYLNAKARLRELYLVYLQTYKLDIDVAMQLRAECDKGCYRDLQAFLSYLLGHHYLKMDDTTSFDECLNDLSKHTNDYTVIYRAILKYVSYCFGNLNLERTVKGLLQTRRKMARTLPETSFKVFTDFHILYLLSTAFYMKGEYAQARRYSLIALRKQLEKDDGFLKIRPYKWLVYIAKNMGNPQEALEYAKVCERIYHKYQIYFDYADILNAWGLIYYDYGHWEDALSRFQLSLEIATKHQYFNIMADALNNLGITYFKLKDYQKAKESYESSIQYRTVNTYTLYIAYTYSNLGEVYRELNQWDTALEYFQNALQKAKKLKLKDAFPINIHCDLALIYLLKKDHKSALQHLKTAEKLNQKLSDHRMTLIIYDLYTQYYKQIQRYKSALAYNDKIKAIRDKLNYEEKKAILKM